MMSSENSVIAKDAVFVGGGHAHALVLKQFGMNPLPSVRFTLISDVTHTPYSGMLSGYLAETYTYDESHIDLRRLCEVVGARFIRAKVSGLDLDSRRVTVAGWPAISFDLLSINIGSTPDIDRVTGARQFATPVKPVPQFLSEWKSLRKKVDDGNRPSIVFVGGGASGVELAISYRQRLGPDVPIHLVDRSAELLPTHNGRVRRLLRKNCRRRDIQLHLKETVTKVHEHGVVCQSGLEIAGDHIVWVTGASAPSWLSESGLALDEAGFIRVSPALQSESHSFVFAAGDIATIADYRRPKSGVYAVRAAKPLAENLRRYCAGQSLIKHIPQKKFLSLISTSDGSAVASRGVLAWHGPQVWRLKDVIDRKFMRKFSDLQPMAGDEPSRSRSTSKHDTGETAQLLNAAKMRCQGCAAKVGGPILQKVLRRIREEFPDVVQVEENGLGLNAPDDAAVMEVPAGKILVQSIDYFPAMVSDPFLLGRILTMHSFSDIFAMGARPHSAIALVQVPFAASHVVEQDVYQCLAGVAHELRAIGAKLLGGHTAEGDRLGLGLTCNGLAEPKRLLRKQGMEPGDLLLLTKPLGIGTLFAAQMRLATRGRWIDAAIESMLDSNGPASESLRKHGATACTDVTGFGLLGHLWEMIEGTGAGVQLDLPQVPVLEGALEMAEAGFVSSIDPHNRQVESHVLAHANVANSARYSLLFDPQTSGGLLASLPQDSAMQCLLELQQAGYRDSKIIGRITQQKSEQRPIVVQSV